MHVTAEVLHAFLIAYAVYGLLKFVEFFLRSDAKKLAGLRRGYAPGSKVVPVFDDVVMVLMVGVVAALFAVGADARSFAAGLLVGSTLIQTFFHRFNVEVRAGFEPPPPVTPLKQMAYAIQASPQRAWRELILLASLLGWSVSMLAVHWP
jgi:hypothetical protein